jgi:hypothetical protein
VSVLVRRGWVEIGSLLAGVDEGQSMPSRLHRSPVVLVVVVSVVKGGWLVWDGGGSEVGPLLTGVEVQPMPRTEHK